MANMDDEYNFYWETKMFLQAEELDGLGFDHPIPAGYYDSSSPDGAAGSSYSPTTTTTTKYSNIAMERNRRRKINESLYALRSVVPNITRMDKISIVKDAIQHIEELQDQERRLVAEISALEEYSRKEERETIIMLPQRKKKKRIAPSIEAMELKVSEVGENAMVASITCNKTKGAMIKTCEVFESLELKVLSASITSLSGSLLHTVCVETQDMDCAKLKQEIEVAIAKLDGQKSPRVL